MSPSALRSRPHALVVALVASALIASACTSTTDNGTATETTSTTSTTEAIVPSTLPIIDEAPSAPVNVVVVDTSDGSIELAWDEDRTGDVTGYEISRVSPAGRTERFTVDTASWLDTGLEDGDVYTYQIVAIGPGGQSDRSDAVTARVGVDTNAPAKPGRPAVVSDSEAAVELAWAPSSDISGIDNYILTRTIDGESTEVTVNEPAWVDDVAAGVIVTYSVRAIDGAGNESEESRSVTVLAGAATDQVIIVVSAIGDPASDPQTERLRGALLDAGFSVTWFEDDVFDSNLTRSDDVVLLLGDVEGDPFDWNLFATDSTIIALKSIFLEAAKITDNPPKLDRLAQLDYLPAGGEPREVVITTTGRPRPSAYIPLNEQIPDLEVWGRPVWSDDIAVMGLIREGAQLANEKAAKGCRAFFPGSATSLAEQTDDAWSLLVEFVGEISDAYRAS